MVDYILQIVRTATPSTQTNLYVVYNVASSIDITTGDTIEIITAGDGPHRCALSDTYSSNWSDFTGSFIPALSGITNINLITKGAFTKPGTYTVNMSYYNYNWDGTSATNQSLLTINVISDFTPSTVPVNINSEWKNSTPYIKVNGVWKFIPSTVPVNINSEWKNSTPYIKVNGVWKPSTMFAKINGAWIKAKDYVPPARYWGVEIDESVSNCYNMVSYASTLSTGQGTYDNTIPSGATPMSGADSLSMGVFGTDEDCAALIEGIKPVSFNGTTWADLNKTNETSWPSTQGTDCFTEFPFRWLSITKSGTKITVVLSDSTEQPDSTFQDWAFLGADGTTRRPNFHLGCYAAIGTVSSKKISAGVYSYKGGTSAVSACLNQYWVAANRRGAEYDCLPYQMWTYLQCLFLVLYKTTNSQAAHSNGISSGTQTNANTGFTYSNDWGMKGTTANKTTENAFFWLHNLWGNMYQFSASVFTRANSNSDYSIYYSLGRMADSSKWDNSSWDNTSTSYRAKQTSIGTDSGSDGASLGNYYNKACGNNEAGFIVASGASAGSASTYYPDYGYVSVNSSYAYFPILGGSYGSDVYCGLFYVYVNNSSTGSDSGCGSRLAYRGGHA